MFEILWYFSIFVASFMIFKLSEEVWYRWKERKTNLSDQKGV